MKFIKPKTIKKSVTWKISENTLSLLKYYSKYTRISEEEIVDEFLENLAADKGFVKWSLNQRNAKKINTLLDYFKKPYYESGETTNETASEVD